MSSEINAEDMAENIRRRQLDGGESEKCKNCDSISKERLARAVALREMMFVSLAENSDDSIVRFDLNFRRTYINPAFERLYGLSAGEMLFKTPSDFCALMDGSDFEEKLDFVIKNGIGIDMQSEYISSHGTRGWWNIKIVPEFGVDNEVASALAIGRDVTDLIEANKRIEFLAYHDPLTGLPNSILARDRAGQMFARAQRNGNRVALLFADIDNFKGVNDSIGHTAGNTILELAAKRLGGCIRKSDTVARHGGDEFLILLPDVGDVECVADVASKIVSIMSDPYVVHENTFSLGVSIGISIFPDDGEDFETLYKKADLAMYEAKEAGKNFYCFFAREMQNDAVRNIQLRNDLSHAIQRDELKLYYQPQIDIDRGLLVGVEVLLRWEHPTKGLIMPDEFIPVAENSGLIVKIGEWVLNEACKQAAKWQYCGFGKIVFAVNISAVQFCRGDLVGAVKKALFHSGFEARYLELEITESVIIKNNEFVMDTLDELKDVGVKLSIDDFGTGYSSLSYLKKFAVDKLKIDRTFVMEMDKNSEDAAIVEAVIKMAKSLKLKTIAEGVENRNVLAMLSRLGCDEAQGFYIAKPIPADEFERFFC